MSMISEFVKELREKSALFSKSDFAVAGIAKDYKEAADTIEELSAKLASANIERSKQYYKDASDTNAGKWIPVSERLPEERDWYLAVFKEPYTGFIGIPYIADYLLGKHTAYTTKEGWIIKDCTDGKDSCEYFKELECVAWQPLPEPYKVD